MKTSAHPKTSPVMMSLGNTNHRTNAQRVQARCFRVVNLGAKIIKHVLEHELVAEPVLPHHPNSKPAGLGVQG